MMGHEGHDHGELPPGIQLMIGQQSDPGRMPTSQEMTISVAQYEGLLYLAEYAYAAAMGDPEVCGPQSKLYVKAAMRAHGGGLEDVLGAMRDMFIGLSARLGPPTQPTNAMTAAMSIVSAMVSMFEDIDADIAAEAAAKKEEGDDDGTSKG